MFSRRILVELVLFVLYALLAGIVSSRLAVGAIAEHSPAEQPRRPAPARIISITVDDVPCGGACDGSMTVNCATSSTAVSSDVLVVRSSDFERLFQDLGCQSRGLIGDLTPS